MTVDLQPFHLKLGVEPFNSSGLPCFLDNKPLAVDADYKVVARRKREGRVPGDFRGDVDHRPAALILDVLAATGQGHGRLHIPPPLERAWGGSLTEKWMRRFGPGTDMRSLRGMGWAPWLAAAVYLTTAGLVASDSLSVSSTALPSPRYATAAAWGGTYAYVAGGLGSGCSDGSSYCMLILRYHPTDDDLPAVGAFPSGRAGVAAVWHDGSAYYLGGVVEGATTTDQIVRYVPTTNRVSVLDVGIPPREFASAVSDGTYVYLFGGCQRVGGENVERHATILRYDPRAGVVDVLNPKLPTGRCGTSAVWDGNNAYVFGGRDDNGRLDEIVKFTPATGSVMVVEAKLSVKRSGSAAVWAGDRAFVIGGLDQVGTPLASVEVYDPSKQTVSVTSTSLPSGLADASAVWTGDAIHIFGGIQTADRKTYSKQILKYVPSSSSTGSPPPSSDEFPPFPDGSGEPASPPPQNVGPRASFTFTVSGSTVYVDASASLDPDGTLASYAWDWGDGSLAGVGKTAAHAYGASGTLTVRLTVTDDRGATDTANQAVSIAPVASARPAPEPTSGGGGGPAEVRPARETPGPAVWLLLAAVVALSRFRRKTPG